MFLYNLGFCLFLDKCSSKFRTEARFCQNKSKGYWKTGLWSVLISFIIPDSFLIIKLNFYIKKLKIMTKMNTKFIFFTVINQPK